MRKETHEQGKPEEVRKGRMPLPAGGTPALPVALALLCWFPSWSLEGENREGRVSRYYGFCVLSVLAFSLSETHEQGKRRKFARAGCPCQQAGRLRSRMPHSHRSLCPTFPGGKTRGTTRLMPGPPRSRATRPMRGRGQRECAPRRRAALPKSCTTPPPLQWPRLSRW